MNRFSEKVQRFCIRAVWLAVLCIVGIFAVAGLFTHSRLRMPEKILHTSVSPLLQLGAGLLMIFLLAGLSGVLRRRKGFRAVVMIAWTAAAALFAYHADGVVSKWLKEPREAAPFNMLFLGARK